MALITPGLLDALFVGFRGEFNREFEKTPRHGTRWPRGFLQLPKGISTASSGSFRSSGSGRASVSCGT